MKIALFIPEISLLLTASVFLALSCLVPNPRRDYRIAVVLDLVSVVANVDRLLALPQLEAKHCRIYLLASRLQLQPWNQVVDRAQYGHQTSLAQLGYTLPLTCKVLTKTGQDCYLDLTPLCLSFWRTGRWSKRCHYSVGTDYHRQRFQSGG